MDLLISANTVPQAQADTAPASGSPGWATDGNPATGQLATDAPAWHYNMMMSELLGIVDAAGIQRSNKDWAQVLAALRVIFSPAQYGVAPYSMALAKLLGGYPKYAIVTDTGGEFWVSTADTNTTVPGAADANWKSLFDGYATQAGSDARYVALGTADNRGGQQIFINWTNTDLAVSIGSVGIGNIAMQDWARKNFLTPTAAASTYAAQSALASEASARQSADSALGSALASEASTRASADIALNAGIVAETSRAKTAEAGKANLNGSNVFFGVQEFNVDSGASLNIGIQPAPSEGCTWGWNWTGGDGQTHWRNYRGQGGGGFTWWNGTTDSDQKALMILESDGTLITSKGTVSFTSELPISGTITGGTYTKTPMNDGTGRSVLRQEFSLEVQPDGSGNATVTFPIACSEVPNVSVSGSQELPSGASGVAVSVRKNAAGTGVGTTTTNVPLYFWWSGGVSTRASMVSLIVEGIA